MSACRNRIQESVAGRGARPRAGRRVPPVPSRQSRRPVVRSRPYRRANRRRRSSSRSARSPWAGSAASVPASVAPAFSVGMTTSSLRRHALQAAPPRTQNLAQCGWLRRTAPDALGQRARPARTADRRAAACRPRRRDAARPCASPPCAADAHITLSGDFFRMPQQAVVISGTSTRRIHLREQHQGRRDCCASIGDAEVGEQAGIARAHFVVGLVREVAAGDVNVEAASRQPDQPVDRRLPAPAPRSASCSDLARSDRPRRGS